MEDKKMTKRDYFETLKGLVEESDNEIKGELIYFIESQIASIDNKSAKAKERAAAKKEAGDAIRETVKSVLTNEFQTVNAITEKIGDEEISKAKVIARLTQLVNLGEAVKEQSKVDGKSAMQYKLAD